MTVDIWYGEYSTYGHEQEALYELYRWLEPQAEHFTVLASFMVGSGGEIDWCILKNDTIFIIELKEGDDGCRVEGPPNGPWSATRRDGQKFEWKRNPVAQVRSNFFGFREWFIKNRAMIGTVANGYTEQTIQRASKSYVVIRPNFDLKNSNVHPTPPIEVMGLHELFGRLVFIRGNDFDLPANEIREIPRLLNLKPFIVHSAKTKRLPSASEPKAKYCVLVELSEEEDATFFNLAKLDKVELTLGRGKENDVVILNDTVSSNPHAKIIRDGNKFILTALESLNGTYVKYKDDPKLPERKLEPGESNLIVNQSVIRLGKVSLVFLLRE